MNEMTPKRIEKIRRRREAKEEAARIREAERQAELTAREKEDKRFMRQAITQARKAAALGEVPIGCVIVCEGKVIARGYNRRNTDKSTLSHAEITAIKKASKKLGDWRLEKCTIYVTLEPCQMCTGAILQARIPTLVIGTMNPKAGCAGSVVNLLQMKEFNHRTEIRKGILEEECSRVLKDFFSDLRIRNQAERI
ncbi:MAG: tRNA adenosine(34) deaminase TadA [Lachnospiraceae bacterium]|nr:tRNA adenosine(34) deaminase TadA [Lachnospiraceae bacterium]